MVTSYFYPLVQLIYAIGAVTTGLIGGIRVSSRISSGDPDHVEDPQPVGSAPASSWSC